MNRMILNNTQALQDFKGTHADSGTALDAWVTKVEAATWKHLLDVRKTFPSADGVTVTRGTEEVTFTVFNIKGDNYRLISKINYQLQTVLINIVLTHPEYDKGRWKNL